MPSELSYTIELKRRKGVSLWYALLRTLPGHYRILRKHNGRLLSLYAALRIVFAGFDLTQGKLQRRILSGMKIRLKICGAFFTALRDLCWTVMGAPVRDEDVTV